MRLPYPFVLPQYRVTCIAVAIKDSRNLALLSSADNIFNVLELPALHDVDAFSMLFLRFRREIRLAVSRVLPDCNQMPRTNQNSLIAYHVPDLRVV